MFRYSICKKESKSTFFVYISSNNLYTRSTLPSIYTQDERIVFYIEKENGCFGSQSSPTGLMGFYPLEEKGVL